MDREKRYLAYKSYNPSRVIKFGTTMHNCLAFNVLKSRQWQETTVDDWDIFYADTGWIHENLPYSGFASGGLRLNEWQKVNHFPNHVELTRKDLMVKNLKRMKKNLEKEGRAEEAKELDFFPQTYHMPSEASLFIRKFKELRQNGENQTWIMKPIGRAQGKGIFLVNKLSQIESWLKERGSQKAENCCYEDYVCQRYINDPMLVCGRKFDLRIYALCLSYVPLKVYLYRDGFARFSNTRFSMNKDDLSNNYIHLTNHSIQKQDASYNSKVTDLKWPIGSLRRHMSATYGPDVANKVFDDLQQLIINSLLSVQKVIINDRHCFELYGYDIMFSEDLKPWLIEVNASPSMSADTDSDRKLKMGLLDDMLSVIDIEQKWSCFGKTPPRVGGFDVIYDENGPTKPHANTSIHSFLGCANDRERQLLQLQKEWESCNAKVMSGAVSQENIDQYVTVPKASTKGLHSAAFR